jgi:MFS family permease
MLALALFVGGLGLGLAAPILVNVVLAGVPGRDAGAAGGVLTTVNQIGGATGVAILGALFFTTVANATEAGQGPLTAYSSALAATMGWQIACYLVAAALMLLLPRAATVDPG